MNAEYAYTSVTVLIGCATADRVVFRTISQHYSCDIETCAWNWYTQFIHV